MEAVILAGGKGTRLRPYTTTLPKPLMPVGEQPILQLVLRQLKDAGVTRVTMAVNHMAEIIMAFFGTGERYGLEIRYSLEQEPLGTVGPLRLIEDLPDNFLVMNGDILTDLCFANLYEHHMRSSCELTIATYKRDAKIDFGVMAIDPESNRVTNFFEKPVYHLDVSMGVYVFSRSIVERLPEATHYGLDNLVLDMLGAQRPVNTFPFDGYWLDIGRPEDYDRANLEAPNLAWAQLK